MKLLFATTNQGKLRETQALLGSSKVELLSLDDYPSLKELEVAETGDTLKENALIKAKTYGDRAQLLTLAEDSGLMVTALDDRPGVHSARYGKTTTERNQRLLRELSELGSQVDRSARFESVLCLYNPQTNKAKYVFGQIKGKISLHPVGKNGFGYDPLFIPEGYEQTFAQLGLAVKNTLSHRHRALVSLEKVLL